MATLMIGRGIAMQPRQMRNVSPPHTNPGLFSASAIRYMARTAPAKMIKAIIFPLRVGLQRYRRARLVRFQQVSELVGEDEIVLRELHPRHVLIDVTEHQLDLGHQ